MAIDTSKWDKITKRIVLGVSRVGGRVLSAATARPDHSGS